VIIEITSFNELKRLLEIEHGYLLIADFIKKCITVHEINCKFCNSNLNKLNSLGKKEKKIEIWFSNLKNQICSKVEEFKVHKFIMNSCEKCNFINNNL
jgi:hypothetical protein